MRTYLTSPYNYRPYVCHYILTLSPGGSYFLLDHIASCGLTVYLLVEARSQGGSKRLRAQLRSCVSNQPRAPCCPNEFSRSPYYTVEKVLKDPKARQRLQLS